MSSLTSRHEAPHLVDAEPVDLTPVERLFVAAVTVGLALGICWLPGFVSMVLG